MTTKKIGKLRWRIVMLLFFATTINYLDRNVLSFTIIDDHFKHEMLGLAQNHVLTPADQLLYKEKLSYVDAAFKLAYALGFVVVGMLIDRIGTKKGFGVSIFVWSLAGMFNGLVSTVSGLSVTRFLLGLGESGNFPSIVKTLAEWFPQKERSHAFGLVNAGSNIGTIVTAFAIPIITVSLGWRWSFILTGSLGLILLFFWRRTYYKPAEHPSITAEELAYINSDAIGAEPEDAVKISWLKLFRYKQTWAFGIGKFLTDGIWYFYLTWLPSFFNDSAQFTDKLNLKTISIPFLIIYIVSDMGSIFFGWLSSKYIKMGWTVNKARKVTLLLCAILVTPIIFASQTSSVSIAVMLIALATAGHQGWSANLFTLTSDIFPKKALASVSGIGGMMGAIGGVLVTLLFGGVLKGSYVQVFIIAGSAYLFALAIIQLLAPKVEKIDI